jgi:LEA14-like dessication related protein
MAGMTKRRRNAIIISSVLGGIAARAFFQAYAAKNMNVELREMEEVGRDAGKTFYDLALKFDNPSILLFLVGDTTYSVTVNGEKVGEGIMEPFVLEPLASKVVNSKFVADTEIFEKYRNAFEDKESLVNGRSTYRPPLFSFDIPFDHEPTPDQMKQFFSS